MFSKLAQSSIKVMF
ncbi:hypothetical protein N0485_002791 [Escherichia coli]|nr:hypothetical protein [Escherichia coli]EHO7057081.1 hypothetical protein [Escherichia coli]EHR1023490.1 hypothetical protein [Escherichia coli]EIH3999679.1 hypothetical protein [Escherichia coli]EIK7909019.1 hypothetical protein [Escherichia coli]EJG2939203.1 hypothetical protein [Escherichia coli]